MKIGSTISGFELLKEKNIPEIDSKARLFEHKKSGAKLLHLGNKDDNKVFSIAFKTPSYDNTGLPHILEHSVLSGSKNFPIKDPFLELMKGSLNTFLNAMTYPDKTVYPIASRNKKDFFNLMNVYLDAVFYPRIYEKEEIFMQEGWNYYLKDKNDELHLNGVVYSEMQGHYSSPESLLEENNIRSLYSDSCYANSSGGEPESIPDLEYENFLQYHKTHYHPVNSYIYLYGDGDLEEQLNFIDSNYLSKFQKRDNNISIKIKNSKKDFNRVNLTYSVSKGESLVNRSYFSLNYATNETLSNEKRLAFHILIYYLMRTKSAPLKQILLKKKIGNDTFGHFEDDILKPYLNLGVKNADLSKREKFLDIVNKTFRQMVDNGLDKDLLESCINVFEFNMKEADYGNYPKGIFYNINCLKNWIYGGDPFEYLSYDSSFKKLRKFVKTNYFEKIIEKYFLKNTNQSFVVLQPEEGLLEKKELSLRKKLDDYKKTLGDEEIDKIIKKTLRLEKYQNKVDSLDDLKKIPKLSLGDIKKKVEKIPTINKNIGGVAFLHNSLETKGICYLNLAFDLRVVPLEKLHSLKILSFLLGRVKTKGKSYEELDVFIQKYTGGCSFGVENFSWKYEDSKYFPKLLVIGKVFEGNFPKLAEIIFEIINETSFSEKKHIKKIIEESVSRYEENIVYRGDQFAVKRLLSYFSECHGYEEYINGITFYHYLKDLLNNFDEKWEFLKSDLEYLFKIIFNKNNLIGNIVCGEKNLPLVENVLSNYFGILKDQNSEIQKYEFPFRERNEGLTIQSPVNYIAQGGNIKACGHSYNGKLLVLNSVLKNEYLWSEIRIKGGAYGIHSNFNRDGTFYFCSYRDPNLEKTFENYMRAVSYLRDSDIGKIQDHIISVIGTMDLPLSPSMKGQKALKMHITGLKDSDLQKLRDDIFSTELKDIKNFSKLLECLIKQNSFCVLGNEQKILSKKGFFNSTRSVFSGRGTQGEGS